MSLSKFKIERTGEVFYYSNELNTILNESGNPVGLETDLLPAEPKYNKISAPSTIKIILGHACNYDCSYCLQKDIGDPSERPKNIMTKELIKTMKTYLDLSKVYRIELWGGETFLYWNDIVEIISALDNSNISWYLPTNGTILKVKHVEFLSACKGKINIGISHDGPGHELLRGPEFLYRKIDVLTALQSSKIDFSFNSVISSINYDLFKINDYFNSFINFAKLNPVPLVFELCRTYESIDNKTKTYVIDKIQLSDYSKILKQYLQQHLKEFKSKEKRNKDMLLVTNLFHFGNGVIPYASSLRNQNPIHHYSNCGADSPNLITIDLNGNLRTCQNTNDSYIYGNIKNIESSLMQNVDYSKDEFCENCSVLRLCNRSCPIKLPFKTFLTNHLVENAHYTEIQLVAFELLFNSNITKID